MIASTTTAGDTAAIFTTMLPVLIVLILLVVVFLSAVYVDRRSEAESKSNRDLLEEIRRQGDLD